jgi:hypothetical protein
MTSIKQSYPVLPQGGMVTNVGRLMLPQQMPGAATRLKNFEPALDGGYRRISGYAKQNDNVVPGQGKILGVHVYYGGVVAARETATGGESQVYYSNGVSWTAIGTARGSRRLFHFHDYFLPDNRLMVCDGVGRPFKWDRQDVTELDDGPVGATFSVEHRSHMFFAVGPRLVISEPNSDTGFDPALGAGEINMGDDIVALASFKGQLIILCENSIYRLEGRTTFDFELITVSQNIGCLARDSVQQIGGQLIFLAPDGLRNIGDTETVGAFDIAIITDSIRDVVDDVTKAYKNSSISSCVIREKTQYRMLCGNPSIDAADTEGIIGAIRKNSEGSLAWEWGELKGIRATCSHSAYAGTREVVVFGSYDGYVYELEKSNSFDGSDINEEYKTPHYVFSDPYVRSTLTKLRTYLTLEGDVDLNVEVEYDYGDSTTKQPVAFDYYDQTSSSVFGTAQFGVDNFAGIGKTTVNKLLTGSGMAASLKFTSGSQSAPYTLHSFIIEHIERGKI